MKKVSSTATPPLAVRRDAPESLYRQIYGGYRQAIIDGNLRPGQRVPSTRVLASELGISRIPVLNAYAQLLAEGYFESRVGSGTVVSRALSERDYQPAHPIPPRKRVREIRPLSRRSKILADRGNLYGGRLSEAFAVGRIASEHFPLRVWNRLLTRHGRNLRASSFEYGDPLGQKDLREAIAAHLRTARGVRCEPGQILIVSGSQQGLEIAARVLLDPGDRVWMEEPGYNFARAVFAFSGCRAVPVPVDTDGLDVAAGVHRCPRARLALVTPSHQFPLGVTLSAPRRLQLLDWADRQGSWILEDDYDSEFRYEGMPITSLQGLDRHARVVYIGTFSKVLFPSLRLGYAVVPGDLVDRFRAARVALDISPPTFLQSVLADFLREGHFARHIRRMRQIYAERRDALIESIRNELGNQAQVAGGQTGMHLSLILKGISDREIARRAAGRKLRITPLSPFYAGKKPRQGFILGFGGTPVLQIPPAFHQLRLLLHSV